jgi:hypothetical protein
MTRRLARVACDIGDERRLDKYALPGRYHTLSSVKCLRLAFSRILRRFGRLSRLKASHPGHTEQIGR